MTKAELTKSRNRNIFAANKRRLLEHGVTYLLAHYAYKSMGMKSPTNHNEAYEELFENYFRAVHKKFPTTEYISGYKARNTYKVHPDVLNPLADQGMIRFRNVSGANGSKNSEVREYALSDILAIKKWKDAFNQIKKKGYIKDKVIDGRSKYLIREKRKLGTPQVKQESLILLEMLSEYFDIKPKKIDENK